MATVNIMLAVLVAMLGLAGQAAEAQVAPVPYGVPGGLVGFGGWGSGGTTYRNAPGFDARYCRRPVVRLARQFSHRHVRSL